MSSTRVGWPSEALRGVIHRFTGSSSVASVRSAELVFGGIDQAGPSFEGRIFLNRADADERTPRIPEMGYAGSFHVYGYGEPSPPAIADAKALREGTRAVAAIEKRVFANEAAVRPALARSEELTITVVTVPTDPGGGTPERPFEDVEVLFDRVATEPQAQRLWADCAPGFPGCRRLVVSHGCALR